MRIYFSIIFILSFLSASAQTGETFVEERMKKAAELLEKEKWQAAKDEYDYVISIQPYNLNAYYYRAYCNDRLLHYGLARADYETILQHEPKHFSSLMGLAVLNQKDKHFTDAIDNANLLVEEHPDSAMSWVVRANIEEEMGHFSTAEYDYRKAYELSHSREHILKVVDMLIAQKKRKEATRELDNLVKSGTPRNSLLYYYKRINSKNSVIRN